MIKMVPAVMKIKYDAHDVGIVIFCTTNIIKNIILSYLVLWILIRKLSHF